jgi:hypothetical protein
VVTDTATIVRDIVAPVRRLLGIVLGVVTACAKADSASPDGGSGDDGSVELDGPSTDGCAASTWSADTDGDGHGDPAASMSACAAPAGHVAVGDDCDDTQPLVRPGGTEVCDGLDNDCASATTEVCSSGCVVRVRPEDNRRYLFCAVVTNWTAASSRCVAEQFRLVRIDDQAEHTYVRTTATAAIGNADLWIGASDTAVEGAWVWPDGLQFWAGGSGGIPVNGLFESWGSGEPNNDGAEDCGELRASNDWNDVACNELQVFVCERY